jgi:hypothetical protein
LAREHVTQAVRKENSLQQYLIEMEEEAVKVAAKAAKFEKEHSVEDYLRSEGYKWNCYQVTAPILTNFLQVKGVRVKTKLKRDELMELARSYITTQPDPSLMSVAFDRISQKYKPTALVNVPTQASTPSLLPEYVSTSAVPFRSTRSVEDDDGEFSITCAQERTLGQVTLPDNMPNPFQFLPTTNFAFGYSQAYTNTTSYIPYAEYEYRPDYYYNYYYNYLMAQQQMLTNTQ